MHALLGGHPAEAVATTAVVHHYGHGASPLANLQHVRQRQLSWMGGRVTCDPCRELLNTRMRQWRRKAGRKFLDHARDRQQRRRALRKGDPVWEAKERAARAARYERIKADPLLLEHRRAYWRAWWHRQQAAKRAAEGGTGEA